MNSPHSTLFRACVLIAVTIAASLAAACSVDGQEHRPSRDLDLEVRTPIGAMSVRTDVDLRETGLPAYPGARLLREHGDRGRAVVTIDSSVFDLDVAAAEFESTDPPASVTAFYLAALRTYGEVLDCRGDIDFRGRSGPRRPVCRERPSSHETTLVVGTEDRHHLVAVEPRGEGSKFAIVRVNTRPGR